MTLFYGPMIGVQLSSDINLGTLYTYDPILLPYQPIWP
jgi:hypothetical protein